VLAILLVTQPAGLLIALVVVAAFGADSLGTPEVLLAFTAGMLVMASLGVFYTAMALGTMSVVAPIAALGVVVPVGVGLARGEAPGAVAFVGLAAAVAGVVILGYEEPANEREPSATRRSVALALVSALGFGGFFTVLGIASADVDSPGWVIVAARAGGVSAALAAVAVVRPDLRGIPARIGPLLAIGAFDITANSLFAVASTTGLLPVVAVGGSMYPAFTILLAHLVLGERLIRVQRLGVALALAGAVLVAGGSA
jgi:drug/metabolite transporter (DMT)-like permease